MVVWYSPEVSCEDTISGYEVRFYDPNFTHSNVTRYVGANRTFYGATEEDRLAGDDTYVQVPITVLHHNNIYRTLPHRGPIIFVYVHAWSSIPICSTISSYKINIVYTTCRFESCTTVWWDSGAMGFLLVRDFSHKKIINMHSCGIFPCAGCNLKRMTILNFSKKIC